MIAQLGDIVFEMLKEPLSMSGSKKWTYAEHPIIWEETKLQYTGHEPKEYSLKIRFHASFCDVEESLRELEGQAQRSGADGYLEPLPFILGSGEVIGEFVIQELSKEYVKFFPLDGRMLEVIADVKMREFV